jgi:CxxC motif-containing protein
MSTVTARFQKSVQRNIHSFGKVRQYQRVLEGVYNIETGTTPNTTVTPITLKMFRSDLKATDTKTPNMVDKLTQVFLIANADIDNSVVSFKPKRGDLIVDDDESFYVDIVNAKDAGDKTAQWRLICYKQ